MCGRVSISGARSDFISYLRNQFQIESMKDDIVLPRYNVGPGQDVIAVLHDGVEYKSGLIQWGFVPPFEREKFQNHKIINAKSETIDSLPTFRQSFQKKRCVIIVDGYYEWKNTLGVKQPMRIVLQDKGYFALAGIWSMSKHPDQTKQFTCAVVTIPASKKLQEIHSRMPLVLEGASLEAWLDTRIQNPQEIRKSMQPMDDSKWHFYPVSSIVNKSTNDVLACIEPLV
jgi:putative SOS response-associated peptidase YedK